MIEQLKQDLSLKLNEKILNKYNVEAQIKAETPKNRENGDVAFPSFVLCKLLKISPVDAAKIVKDILSEFENI